MEVVAPIIAMLFLIIEHIEKEVLKSEVKAKIGMKRELLLCNVC